jgi:hypothetical protein
MCANLLGFLGDPLSLSMIDWLRVAVVCDRAAGVQDYLLLRGANISFRVVLGGPGNHGCGVLFCPTHFARWT